LVFTASHLKGLVWR